MYGICFIVSCGCIHERTNVEIDSTVADYSHYAFMHSILPMKDQDKSGNISFEEFEEGVR